MNRRIALLIAAVVVAAIGTTLVFLYVRGANDRAIADQKPVEVLIAKTQINQGTSVSAAQAAGAFEPRKLPQDSVVPGALSNLTPISGSVALATVYPGQQIVASMFGATPATATNILSLPPGMIATSYQFGDPQRVAGFVKPGSNVVVFVTTSVGGATGNNGVPGDFTRVLVPKALVVAVGPTTITPPTDPKNANVDAPPRALLTLALSQVDTEKLIYASQKGPLYLGLLNDKSKVTPGPGVNSSNLFN